MRHHRGTLWRGSSCALCLFLLGLSVPGRAEDSSSLAAFDGFWERERMTGEDGARRVIWQYRSSSNPYREGVTLSDDNVIRGETLVFLKEGCPSPKRKGTLLEFHEGGRVTQRDELLGQDRIRVSLPMNPKSQPRDYRRIAEPVGGLRGGQESLFASFPRTWRNTSDGSVLIIALDRGKLSLTRDPRKGPLPGTLSICSAFVVKDFRILILSLPEPYESLQVNMRDHDGAGRARVSLRRKKGQQEDIGIFSATGP